MSTFSRLKENVPLIFFQKESTVEILLRDVLPQGLRSSAHDDGKTNLLVGPFVQCLVQEHIEQRWKIAPKQRTHLVMALRILASSR